MASFKNEEDKGVETKERRAALSVSGGVKRLKGERETGEERKEELQKRIRRD